MKSIFLLVLFYSSILFAKEKVLIIETVDKKIPETQLQVSTSESFDEHGIIIKEIIDRNDFLEGQIIEGNIDSEKFWQLIDQKLTQENIRFVNMSFAMLVNPITKSILWDNLPAGQLTPEQQHEQICNWLKNLISKHPEVLFLVAAGNGAPGMTTHGVPVDKGAFKVAPASFALENILTVSSVRVEESAYAISSFSNFGLKHIDIFAPGENVTTHPESTGTSFATPIVFSAVNAILKHLPDASVDRIKSIILKTATIPDVRAYLSLPLTEQEKVVSGPRKQREEFFNKHPQYLPVRSGGVLNAKAAGEVAWHLANSSQNLEQSVQNVLYSSSPQEFLLLQEFWQQRGL